MGNYLPTFNTTQTQLRVWYLNKDQIFNVPTTTTLKQLKLQLNNLSDLPKSIFYNWTPVQQRDENITLSKIVQECQKTFPYNNIDNKLFIVIDQSQIMFQSEQKNQTRHNKLLGKLKSIQKVDEKQAPTYQIGHNGRIVFQGREKAVYASAVSFAMGKTNATPQKLSTLLQGCQHPLEQCRKPSLIGKLFTKIGLISNSNKQFTRQTLTQLTQKIKSSNQFSDFDPKFVYFILQIYFKFMVLSKGKIHYIDYKDINDFNIHYISSKSKIGIIGDFGTGLKDSIQLLSNMILKHQVDVIFHLGDVYYAGTPLEYEVGIVKPLTELRVKAKKEIRFYSIPGNHDYYSWGLPFLCFVKGINEQEFHKQQASYFCIRDELNKWQFLGMDTAYFDSNPLNQIYPGGVGPHVQNKELLWHKHRLQNFPGSTILMTHHQLFSIHERINGKLTKYRKFSCINPMLSAEMFEYMGNISAWYWGHEHSLMLFKQNIFGLSKGRLLGNSSFHVMFDKQNPYSRQAGFPYIPFIVQDKEYIQKYLPVNPNIPGGDYFALSYAVIDMGKMDQEGNLPVEYWCSPSYSNDEFESFGKITVQEKRKIYFEEYMVYREMIYSIKRLKKDRVTIKDRNKVYLRCEIGLSLIFNQQPKLEQNQNTEMNINDGVPLENKVQQNKQISMNVQTQAKKSPLSLNLSASAFEIQVLDQKYISNHHIWEFALKLVSQEIQKRLYLGVKNNCVELIQIHTDDQLQNNNAIWICQNMDHEKHKAQQDSSIFYGQPIKIHNKLLKKSLTWQIIGTEAYPTLQEPQYELKQQQLLIQRINEENLESLWMFQRQHLIHE